MNALQVESSSEYRYYLPRKTELWRTTLPALNFLLSRAGLSRVGASHLSMRVAALETGRSPLRAIVAPHFRGSLRKPLAQSVDENSAIHEVIMLRALWRLNGQKKSRCLVLNVQKSIRHGELRCPCAEFRRVPRHFFFPPCKPPPTLRHSTAVRRRRIQETKPCGLVYTAFYKKIAPGSAVLMPGRAHIGSGTINQSWL
jgi:hypothetical protein